MAARPAPRGKDVVSFLNALPGKSMPKCDYPYREFHEARFSQGVQTDNGKGVRRKSRNAPIGVYDIAGDIGEIPHMSASKPELVARFKEIMRTARTESTAFTVKEL